MSHAPAISKLNTFAADIKIGHTVFALPFALFSALLAAGGSPRTGQLGLILLCMVTARTVAMSANRLLDAELDARNPRTANRAIPAKKLSRGFVATALLLCAAAFIGSTALFQIVYHNIWPLILSVPVLGFVCAYPLLKRFTQLCHYYLGAALALAPICAWIAIAGLPKLEAWLIAGAVLCWTAGFDIIYACQDFQSDRECGVFSVPAKIGIARALWVSRATHIVSAALLITLGLYSPALSTIYFVGVGIAIALLLVEHAIVKPNDLSKVGVAFFTINGVISLVVGTLGIIDSIF